MSTANKTGGSALDAPRPELRAVLMPAVPTIVEAAIAAIRGRDGPEGRVQPALERNLRRGLIDAVDRWFDAEPRPTSTELHFALGRAQARAGRSLDELMTFYRIAGQTMWRRLTEVGTSEGVEPEELYRLADTGFGCVDELSTQAAAGFTDEQSHRSGTSHSRRSELVRLLLKDPQTPPETLAAAARAVAIELRPRLAAFVGPAEQYDTFAHSARGQLLLGPREGEFVGVIFDPDGPGRRRELRAEAARAGVALALGPTVSLSRARDSLMRARALLALVRAGLVEEAPLAEAELNDVALLMGADPQLAGELARRRLAPLEEVRGANTRAKLAATLAAWLRMPGQRKAIAQALGVHPQTVRYRMTRLRELFGDALDDTDTRFELALALRALPYAALVPDERAGSRAWVD